MWYYEFHKRTAWAPLQWLEMYLQDSSSSCTKTGWTLEGTHAAIYQQGAWILLLETLFNSLVMIVAPDIASDW